MTLWLTAAGALLAQSQTGRITGRITDPGGAVVPGAEVVATEMDTGVPYKGTSSATGIYAVPFLQPGRYRVEVSHTGFKKYERANLDLGTNEVLTLDIELELGRVTETVTVSEAAPLLESSTSDVGQFVDPKTVAEMPLNGRRALALVAVGGATVWVSYGGEAKPNFSLAGGRVQSQMFWLDGGNGQNMRLGVGQVDIDPPVEVIREFRVMHNTYAAEFGGSAGGLIISTTKSGTNQMHGSGFEYFRNDKMDARQFFAAAKPPLRYNLFGGTLGGPIRKNRTHYFAGFEGTRRSTGLVSRLTVPTAEQRRGDFSQTTNAAGALTRIFDPSSNRVVAGRNVRDQFTGNVIPASRLDPVAVKLMEFYPAPNRPPDNRAGANNFVGNYSRIFRRDNVTAKIDHVLHDRNRLYFRFVYNRDPLRFTTVHPNPLSDTNNASERHQATYLAADTHTFTPNLVADFRVSFSARTFHSASPGLGSNGPELLGLKGVPSGAFPTFGVSGIMTLGAGTHERVQMPIRQQQVVNSWTWVRGNHVVKLGGEMRRSTNVDIQRGSISGNFSFSTQPTALEGTANTGFGLASLLVGFPNSVSLRATDPLDRYSYYLAGYLQDDWKIHPHLTLNLGVRWETDTPIMDKNNRMNGFDPTARNPISGTPGVVRFAGLDGWPRNPYGADWNNFGPRFGFAWKPWGSGKTVVRGGFGIYYAHPFDHGVPNVASLGFEQSLNLTTPDNGVTAPFYLRDGVPPLRAAEQKLDASFGAVPVGRAVTTNVQFYENNRRTGYSQQFNFGVQREFRSNLLVEVTYLGNLSRKLSMENLNINQIPPFLVDAVRPAGVNRQAYRPFPQFNAVTLLQGDFGITDYHAGVLKVEKRFSKGWSFLGTYTWSKNLGNLDASAENLGDDQQYSNYYNRRADKGPEALDIQHRVTWSSVYELPLRGRWLGGWSVGAIAIMQSGGPFTVTTQTNTTNVFSSGAQRANVLRDPNLPNSEKSLTRWFDTSAFELPAPFTFGNAGRGIVRADGRVNFDFSLVKNFRFSENAFAQLRGEVFNAFNHPDFGLPGTALGGPGFGVINDSTEARVLQLGLRVVF
jgi:hypothetical protein